VTRTLTIGAVLLLVVIVGSIIGGLAANAPALLMLGFLCALPLFMLTLGAALGRASNEFVITRKAARSAIQPIGRETNSRQIQQREPLS
jgi:hypothetical protein